MHDEAKPDAGTVGLVTAIIRQAVQDSHTPKHRDSAKSFFASLAFVSLADAIGLDPDAIRKRLKI